MTAFSLWTTESLGAGSEDEHRPLFRNSSGLAPRNSTTLSCPLCSSNASVQLGVVDPEWIVRQYRSGYAFDVRRFFSGTPVVKHKCKTCGLGYFTGAEAGDGAYYAVLQREPWYYRKEKWEYGAAAAEVEPGMRVLDVGCGEGYFSSAVPEACFTGLELNEAAVMAAKASGRDVRHETVQAHAVANAAAYDMVASFQVLEHVSQPWEILRSMAALIRPGGCVVVAVPDNESYLGNMPNQLLNLPPHHMLHWSRRPLQFAGTRLGLELLRLENEPLDPLHRTGYLAYLGMLLLRGRGFADDQLVDGSFTVRCQQRLGLWFAQRLMRGGAPATIFPGGQTVLAVYRKLATST